MNTEYSASLMEKTEIILNTINHVFIGFTTIYMSGFFIRTGLEGISLHAWLSLIGYQLLMAEGILSLNKFNSWNYLTKRKCKRITHWFLQVLGSVIALTGVFLPINKHGLNIKSIHAITGFVSILILLFNLLTGLAALYAEKIHKIVKPVINKLIHNLLGIISFVLGMISLYYGYDKGFVKKDIDKEMIGVLKSFTIITLLISLIKAVQTCIRQIKQLFE